MKVRLLALFIVGATAAMPLLSQTNKTAHTSSGAGDPVPLAHVRNSFTLTVHAPYKIAAPLFGPNGERVWAGDDWDPQFIYPHGKKQSTTTWKNRSQKVFELRTTASAVWLVRRKHYSDPPGFADIYCVRFSSRNIAIGFLHGVYTPAEDPTRKPNCVC